MKGLILLGEHSNIPYFRNQTVRLSGNAAGMQLGFKKNSVQVFPDRGTSLWHTGFPPVFYVHVKCT